MSDAKVNNRNRAEQAFDHDVRILQIVDMACMTATEAFDDRCLDGAMEDFVDHLLDEGEWKHDSTAELSGIMQLGIAENEALEDEEERQPEHLIRSDNALYASHLGILGIALQFGSTVRKYLSEECYQAGFGYMRTTWIYADTFDEAWALGMQWAVDKHEEDKAKYKGAA